MAEAVRAEHVRRFAAFEMDLRAGELRKHGVKIKLAGQPFQVLEMLLERPGEVVTREELQQRLWPVDTFVDFDNSLNTAINKIREALGDSADNPRFVETLPRRGYRFIVPLKEAKPAASAVVVLPGVAAARKERRSQLALIVGLTTSAAMGMAFGLYYWLGHRKAAPFEVMKVTRLTTTGDVERAATSPDGKYAVYVREEAGQQSLWTRQVATGSTVRIVPPAPVEYLGLTFSADGNYIYFVRRENVSAHTPGALHQVPVLGGGFRKIMDNLSALVTFSPEGRRLAFLRDSGTLQTTTLAMANLDGTGERKLATRKGAEFEFFWSGPTWSPDGKLIAIAAGKRSAVAVVAVEAETGKERVISSKQWIQVWDLAWLADGSGLVMAAQDQADSPLQLWQLSYPRGEARRITNDLNSYETVSPTSDSRSLVAVQVAISSNVWIIPEGHATRARQVASGTGRFGLYSRLSWLPDGRILYSSTSTGEQRFWISSLDGSNSTEVPLGPGASRSSAITCPDGRYIVFASSRSGNLNIWRADTDGGNPRQLTLTRGPWELFPDCSPDGKWVVYTSRSPIGETLQKVPIEGGNPVPLIRTRLWEGKPAISPDGKWVASLFKEDAAHPWKLAVIPFVGGEPVKTFAFPTSTSSPPQGGIRWTPRGDAVAYVADPDHQNIWAQPLSGGPLRKLTNFSTDKTFAFAWSRDGKQLAVARGTRASDAVLITNFR